MCRKSPSSTVASWMNLKVKYHISVKSGVVWRVCHRVIYVQYMKLNLYKKLLTV